MTMLNKPGFLPKYFFDMRIFKMMTTFLIGGSLESHYRLLLAFCPKIWGGDRDLQMVLCDFMNAGSVVGIP